MKNYRIKYLALDKNMKTIKEGEVIAKNKLSEFDALAGYENHLKKTLPGFNKMQCLGIEVDTILGFMPTESELNSIRNDRFKQNFDSFMNGFNGEK